MFSFFLYPYLQFFTREEADKEQTKFIILQIQRALARQEDNIREKVAQEMVLQKEEIARLEISLGEMQYKTLLLP
jgi:hypothetical protein